MIRAKTRRGFSLLELQVTLGILAVGLLGIASLLALAGRQMRRTEAWCANNPTYYVHNQPSRWMRLLAAPADLTAQPGDATWSPPVGGSSANDVAVQQWQRDLDGQDMSATAVVSPKGGE